VKRESDEIVEVIAELQSLARKRPLKGENLARAKELMKILKENNFTNKEISELTSYSVPTVKLYTRGVAVKDSKPKEELLKLLSQMIETGLKLDQVKLATAIKARLDAIGVGFEDLVALLEEVKKSGVSLRGLVEVHRELKTSGLSIPQLAEALSYKSKLEEVGLTVERLMEIHEISKAYGGYEGLMEALRRFGSLQAMEAELEKKRAQEEELEKKGEKLRRENEALEGRAEGLKREIEKLEGKRASVEGALRLYDELRAQGFDEEVLKELKELSEKHKGIKGLLDAVSEYRSLADIEEEKSRVEAELKRVQADYAHLQTVIGVLEELLYKHKFSPLAMAQLYKLAKKYGGPIEVLEALEKYGELKALDKEVEERKAEVRGLDARASELREQVKELGAMKEELKNEVKGSLKLLANEVKKTLDLLKEASSSALSTVSSGASKVVELLEKKCSEVLEAVTKGYEEYARRYGELKADAGRLEEELRLARIVKLLVENPSECKGLPLDYALLMLNVVINFLNAKGVDPKISEGPWERTRVTDLLRWALEALEKSLKKAQLG